MSRAISTHRPPVMILHRARPTKAERMDDMEPYKSQIIAMLDTITDAKLMRLVHDVVKAILFNR